MAASKYFSNIPGIWLGQLICISLIFFCSQFATASEAQNQLIASELSRVASAPDSSVVISITQPIDLVFDTLLTKLDEYSESITSISFDNSSSENIGEVGIGSERFTTMDDGKELIQRIVVFDPPNKFAYFTDMTKSTVNVPIDYSIGYYELSEQTDGSVKAEVSVAYKPSSRLTAFLVRIGFDRALARDFQKAEEYLNALTP